ncbi:type I DNA topoisomerase [Lentisphaera profundi]|uniref:DNA topoisomerase 1 n=1 Tax=Lentisphaera profundi TaxID=1658616 RepID=A0ABY7W019_9BACT|nr:type I DNA topoisomerase [Lentisphaera profundi]WDE98381.1 type I DNA topoisomerase [Lentisphaera profundi]
MSKKNLVIVESPAKAKTIEKILGKDFEVKASFGHIRDLPQRKLGVDPENNFEPEYQVSADKKKVIAELKSAAKNCENIYLAPDPDREGEAIAWHLYEILKKQSKAEFKRVTFNEITKSAIKTAFEKAHEVDMNRVDAQQARRILDRLVGYKVSPLLWKRNARSAGRVQTVALRLICEREKAILAFTPEEYWSLQADIKNQTEDAKSFISKLDKIDGKKPIIGNAERSSEILSELEGSQFRVKDIESKDRQKRPAPPFITSTLQQAASSNMRFSPSRTMSLAQKLYEGRDLGSEGTAGLITYMRTDSVAIAKEAQDAAIDFVNNIYGSEFSPDTPNFYKSKNKAQGGHEAIRPTDVTRTPKKMAPYLNDDELKLYTLIWKRFVASQMVPALYRQDSITFLPENVGFSHEYLFKITGSVLIFDGFMKVYNFSDDGSKEGDSKDVILPQLTKGEICDLLELIPKQHFTEPPPRFSEATLVKELEANGVGRPSTYASIIRTIQDREYVVKDKGRLNPSDKGMESCDFLVATLPALFEVSFTAHMEELLDKVESGELVWTTMLADFYSGFSTWLQDAKTAGAPDKSIFAAVLDAIPEDISYQAPTGKGKSAFSDEEFVGSIRESLTEDKPLSEKQWQTLLRVLLRYETVMPALKAKAEELGFEPELQEIITKTDEEQKINAESKSTELLALLEDVTFEEPQKPVKGRRTFNEANFYKSLKTQSESGRNLTINQINALKKMVLKYQKQIDNFEAKAAELKLEIPEEAVIDPEESKEITALLKALSTITEWNAPTKRGRMTYDDKSFYESLSSNFANKGSLTPRQLAALKKSVARYKEKIPAELYPEGLEDAKGAAEEKTDVKCPKCDSPIVKKMGKRGPFYACSAFPKCKNLADSLEKFAENSED